MCNFSFLSRLLCALEHALTFPESHKNQLDTGENREMSIAAKSETRRRTTACSNICVCTAKTVMNYYENKMMTLWSGNFATIKMIQYWSSYAASKWSALVRDCVCGASLNMDNQHNLLPISLCLIGSFINYEIRLHMPICVSCLLSYQTRRCSASTWETWTQEQLCNINDDKPDKRRNHIFCLVKNCITASYRMLCLKSFYYHMLFN